jgi:hypothetical protein
MWEIFIDFLVTVGACIVAISLVVGLVLLVWKYEMKKLDPNYRDGR